MRRIPLYALMLAGLGCGEKDPMAAYEYPTAPGYGRFVVGLSATEPAPNKGGGNGGGASQNNVLDLSEILVDVDRVTAHVSGGGWVTLSETPALVDILRLSEFGVALGFADLPEGRINQIRLHVIEGSAPTVTLLEGGQSLPLKVPSGMESGIKLNGPWDINACTLTTADVNLELKRSIEKAIHVHPTGHEDLWILRPVIKLGGSVRDVGCDDDAAPPDGNPDPTLNPDDDGDGIPDVSDPDANGDGVLDDGDGDGIPNSDDLDDDGDGFPDAVDTDDDADGVPDTMDPDWPTPDSDGDGVPDLLDPVNDTPGGMDPVSGDADNDADGLPDLADSDDDNDGIPDAEDPEPRVPGDGTTDPVGGGSDTPPPPGGGCSDSSECGPTAYCGPSSTCEPLL